MLILILYLLPLGMASLSRSWTNLRWRAASKRVWRLLSRSAAAPASCTTLEPGNVGCGCWPTPMSIMMSLGLGLELGLALEMEVIAARYAYRKIRAFYDPEGVEVLSLLEIEN